MDFSKLSLMDAQKLRNRMNLMDIGFKNHEAWAKDLYAKNKLGGSYLAWRDQGHAPWRLYYAEHELSKPTWAGEPIVWYDYYTEELDHYEGTLLYWRGVHAEESSEPPPAYADTSRAAPPDLPDPKGKRPNPLSWVPWVMGGVVVAAGLALLGVGKGK